jgi:hypothetical protein
VSEEINLVEAPATTDAPAQEAPATAAPVVEAPVAPTPSWKDEISKVDPKELRSHERVAGIIGSEVQKAVQNYERSKLDELNQRARKTQEDDMIRLANENPEYVKEHYPGFYEIATQTEKRRAMDEVQGLKGQAVNEFATQVGRAIQDLPEWGERTQEEWDDIAKELVGKSDNEVMSVFNRKVIDLVAKKRTAKAIEDFKAKELPKERAAIRLEIMAEQLKQSDSPDTTRPKSQPGKVNPADMPQADFDKYWETLKTR